MKKIGVHFFFCMALPSLVGERKCRPGIVRAGKLKRCFLMLSLSLSFSLAAEVKSKTYYAGSPLPGITDYELPLAVFDETGIGFSFGTLRYAKRHGTFFGLECGAILGSVLLVSYLDGAPLDPLAATGITLFTSVTSGYSFSLLSHFEWQTRYGRRRRVKVTEGTDILIKAFLEKPIYLKGSSVRLYPLSVKARLEKDTGKLGRFCLYGRIEDSSEEEEYPLSELE